MHTTAKQSLVAVLLVLAALGRIDGQDAVPPAADGRAGMIDLRGRDWAADGPAALDGTWLIDGRPLRVPGHLLFADGSPNGRGTYGLDVLTDPGAASAGKPLALRLPMICVAMRLTCNGEVLAVLGAIGDDAASERPEARPLIVVLPPSPDGAYRLRIEFSNHHDIYAGINYSLRVGPYGQVVEERNRDLLHEAVVFGGLFLLALYQIGSFFFRMDKRAPLWLALLGLAMAVRATMYSELLAVTVFPGLSWMFITKTVYFCMPMASLGFINYFRHLFPELVWKPVVWASWAAVAAYGAINVLGPIQWTTALLPPFHVFMVCLALYGLAVMVRALARGEPGAGLFLAGLIVLVASLGLDILKIYLIWPLPSMINIGLLTFMLAQALVMARTFNHHVRLVEDYSDRMGRLNTSLERFIPKEILALLSKKDITEIKLGDYAELPMTVFFLDIRDFTGLSESMSPQENFEFINSFFQRFGPIVRQNGGFVDKYIGDGIMGLFPNGALAALRAAQDMREGLAGFNGRRERAGQRPIRFGIGIHTGPLMLGTIGENHRMDPTVISDTVNVASRLEGLTKKYGTDILVSGDTVRALDPERGCRFSFVASETVKGKTRPVDVYRLDGIGPG